MNEQSRREFEALVLSTIGDRYDQSDFRTGYERLDELRYVNEDLNRMYAVVQAARASAERVSVPCTLPEGWVAEALRVLKPGGHLLSFASTRTCHRMTCGIEEAGFEIRDQIGWLFGSGFPKSRNLDGEWAGWGTALKPAWEPIVLARKPLIGTVARNVELHGVGALNIDGCRVLGEEMPPNMGAGGLPRRAADEQRGPGIVAQPCELGRWPANVIHDGSDDVLAAFPDAPGQLADASTNAEARKTQNVYGVMARGRGAENGGVVGFQVRAGARRLDEGSAARFFYCAKTSKAERNMGCEALPDVPGGMVSNTSGQHITRRDGGAPGPTKNNHPTVKPIALMRYLIRLVTPPGGVVLDPFLGSGTTACAAVLEGMGCIGIEKDVEHGYIAIAEARIAAAVAQRDEEQALERAKNAQHDMFADYENG